MSETSAQPYAPQRRLIFMLGTGGVGKTTCSVLLANALAQSGRSVLLLTVDPARRLESLMSRLTTTTTSLTIEQMDIKSRFKHFVERHSPDAETASQVLESRFYPYLSGRLQALHEYVSGDRILEVVEEGRYDHVVVDTPPFSYALHFLEAPQRLQQMAGMAHSVFAAGKSGGQAIKKLSPLLVRGLSYFVGKGFLSELVSFVASLGRLWGEVERTAGATQELYRSEAEFGVVVRPDQRSTGDLAEFLDGAPEWLVPSFIMANQVLVPAAGFAAPDGPESNALGDSLSREAACRAWRPSLVTSAAATANRLAILAQATVEQQRETLAALLAHPRTRTSARLLTVPLVLGGLSTPAQLQQLSKGLKVE